ncbi:hypothetical protein CDL15_Pgr004034 [Punica granatum]|uniref:PRP1 splicing factor N-terminal domain-containing protein n=1 Tax=Punica granatum TaxID=22663 RepID=A0A218XEF9_PUNGR|nr:hypothetical protein CDL15_Pgr004034 [Punica granatum]
MHDDMGEVDDNLGAGDAGGDATDGVEEVKAEEKGLGGDYLRATGGDGELEFDDDDERDDKGYDENWKFDEFEGNDMGVFASAKYDEDDKGVDAVWEAIDKKMDSQRKYRREARLKQEIEKYRASNQQMRARMSDVSIKLITATEYFESEFFPIIRSGAWANIDFRSSMEDVYVCVDNFISGLLGGIRGRILSTHGRMMRQKT